MSHLNLLPWRETLKREREIRLAVFTGASLAVAGVVVLSAHLFMEGLIDYQESRNNYLGREIKRVEAQIKEIEDLEKKKQRLIDRMNVIQELESNRPKIVHLFDELVKQLPDGVYFTALEQKNDKLTLEGIAQSDARVSSLMRNIEKSQWFQWLW
jgi:type IV pilus assembly protein PilN